MCSDAILVHPRDDAGSTRGTDSGSGIRVRVSYALLREHIEIWGDCMWIAIAAQVRADVFA